jgi:hypothetical protein
MYQFAWTPGYYPMGTGGFFWQGTSDYLDDRGDNLVIPYSYFKDSPHCAEDDASRIPYTPTITYIGEVNYPINDLRFETSAFSDPQGSGTFAALKWRIGRHDGFDPADPGTVQKRHYELRALWESEEITNSGDLDIQIPGSVVTPGRTYRVRCKMKDNTGRWSHWSAPIEFVAGVPLATDILDYLRVSELMYNPEDDPNTTYDHDEFEFIELKNISTTETLDLSTVSITDGVEFDFAGSNVTSLAPSEFVLVVGNETAFESRYGTSLSSKIAGTYDGRFDNAGEEVEISDTWNGVVVSFTYNDGYGWPQAADGAGHSLVPKAWWAMEDQQEEILSYAGNWRQSSYIYGSPASDDPAVLKTVVLNEFMAHTDYENPEHPEYDSNDWIELYNASGSTVNLNSDWYLSDDIDDLKKFALPSVPVNSGAFISFDEINGFHNPITSGFGLDKTG